MPFPIYDTEDAVPEGFRTEYEERDGKWHPKVPDVTKLNSALEAERTRAATEETARKKAERELADVKRKETAAQHGITDEQLKSLRDEDAQKRKPIEDENAALKAENRKLKLTDRVQKLALDNGVMPDRIEDAMMNLERRVDLTDGDNIVVKDKAGNVTTEKVEDFLAKTFRQEKPWLYQGTGASGSGAQGSGGNGGGGKDGELSMQELVDRKRATGKYAA